MYWTSSGLIKGLVMVGAFSAIFANSSSASEFEHLKQILERGDAEQFAIAHQCAALFHSSIELGGNAMDEQTLEKYKAMRSTAQKFSKISLEKKGLSGEDLILAHVTGYLEKLTGYYTFYQELGKNGENPFASSDWQADKEICVKLFDLKP
ncbi:hypothetical protein OEZ60_06795 [Defluviimonas sp. WL0024]|uniref:Uncharacterized protein n=1 Tax=Albidovulum salinarum TaxID=2984153 RepID=A0ABT2X198_9RHOB|nr:hypothetical protein [Defluviimonas sp. WL0024]MCU9847712.1 hypothetical protein [Defluviimonas sp. WL0024]